MNIERLHNLLFNLNEENTELKINEQLQRFITVFTQNINQPSPQTADAYIKVKEEFWNILSQTKSNRLSPSNLKMLKSIKGENYYGLFLKEKIENIINENISTPGKAIEQLTIFQKEALQFYNNVSLLIKTLDLVNIEYEYTDKDEYEIGILLPVYIIDNNIEKLAKELNIIDRHLKTIGELVAQDTSSPTLRVITNGSPEIDVFINALPQIAEFFANAIEKIVIIYRGILGIREIRERMKASKFPTDLIKQVDKHEKDNINGQLEAVADDLIKIYRKKQERDREKELRNYVLEVLKYIAKRIDQGADFEVTPPSVKEELNKDGKASDAEIKKHKEIETKLDVLFLKGQSTKQLPSRTQQILSLPEPEVPSVKRETHIKKET